ncbi:MAG: putative zinc-binding protein, partial [Deltaproteobacteria bacterium]|nr:putative zinc-binding protein [Deltaproteobacteria bacterium]
MSTDRAIGCGCGSSERATLVFACSGASNVGQITNELALRMTREGLGKMSCLAGVGAHLGGFVVPARDCDQLVVLDGCPQKCAAKLFEHVGITPHVYLMLTDHGFQKSPGAPVLPEEVDRARALVL